MALLEQWHAKAYNEKENKGVLQKLWQDYFAKEKEIYAQILEKPEEVVTGTVKELADKFNVDIMTMTGFLDGINDSLKEKNPIEEMEEDTVVNLGFDLTSLYKNMVAAGADWLYNLPQWEPIFTTCPSGSPSLRKRSVRNSIWNRRSPVPLSRDPRSIPTIPAPAEAARNTRSATAGTDKKPA